MSNAETMQECAQTDNTKYRNENRPKKKKE